MKRTASVILSILLMALLCSGCLVAQSQYMVKVDEVQKLTQNAASLTRENHELKERVQSLTVQRKDLSETVKFQEKENSRLRENLKLAAKKTQEVEKASSTYQALLKEMKGEIARGQITIKELEGKLTMDVVDKILFASGETKVKKEGLEVLGRVVEILKNVKDKNIRIEGHTDNVKIVSRIAATYPTNWELSAARAINVTKYLQEHGIDPMMLSATAFGEYQPVASNATPEGRAKNRRIAIILLPRD